MSLNIGTRIRVRENCSWPERAGCVGVIVAPSDDGIYPQPAASECVVLLDNDPLQPPVTGDERWWSCVLPWKQIQPESVPVRAFGLPEQENRK